MNSSAIQSTEDTDGRYRALYILVVACFPVVLGGIFTLMVFVSGAVQRDDGIGHNTEFAQFNYPVPGDLVSDQFELDGVIKSIPDGEVVYLAELSEGKYWPKRRLGQSTKSFKATHFAKQGKGFKYTIIVLSVGSVGESQIDSWFEHGKKTGKYPGISVISDSKPLAKTRVIHQ